MIVERALALADEELRSPTSASDGQMGRHLKTRNMHTSSYKYDCLQPAKINLLKLHLGKDDDPIAVTSHTCTLD